MTNRWFKVVILLVVASGRLRADEPAQRDIRITGIRGSVTLKMEAHHKQTFLAAVGTPLLAGDVVETGPASSAEITMDATTVFKLLPESLFSIKKMSLKDTELDVRGILLASAKPAMRADQVLIMKLRTALFAFRRSEFGVETRDGLSHIGVFNRGPVVVEGLWGHERVKLERQEETTVPMSNVPQQAHGLARWKGYQRQMRSLRARAAYWQANWKPIGPKRRQKRREQLHPAQ